MRALTGRKFVLIKFAPVVRSARAAFVVHCDACFFRQIGNKFRRGLGAARKASGQSSRDGRKIPVASRSGDVGGVIRPVALRTFRRRREPCTVTPRVSKEGSSLLISKLSTPAAVPLATSLHIAVQHPGGGRLDTTTDGIGAKALCTTRVNSPSKNKNVAPPLQAPANLPWKNEGLRKDMAPPLDALSP